MHHSKNIPKFQNTVSRKEGSQRGMEIYVHSFIVDEQFVKFITTILVTSDGDHR